LGDVLVVSISRVVEILSSVNSKFTLEDVVSKLKVSPRTARKYIGDLLKAGFITVENGKYVVTEKGLLLLEVTHIRNRSTSADQAYVFTDEKGSPLVLRVDSITKLYVAVKYGLVPESVLKHHLEKGYLAKWLSEVLGAKLLAERVARTKTANEFVVLLEEYLSS